MHRISFLILLIIIALSSHRVEAKFVDEPLDYVIKQQTVLVDATIIGSEVIKWEDSENTCGTTYQARVNECFDGSVQEVITFSAIEKFDPGERYLFFLRSIGSFPDDTIVDRTAEELRMQLDCENRLHKLKSDWRYTAKFICDDNYIELGLNTIPPPEVRSARERVTANTMCKRSRTWAPVVEWQELRRWILDKLGGK